MLFNLVNCHINEFYPGGLMCLRYRSPLISSTEKNKNAYYALCINHPRNRANRNINIVVVLNYSQNRANWNINKIILLNYSLRALLGYWMPHKIRPLTFREKSNIGSRQKQVFSSKLRILVGFSNFFIFPFLL